MILEDMTRVVAKHVLKASGYTQVGNYMQSVQGNKVYRFILAINNQGYIFDGVEDSIDSDLETEVKNPPL